MSREHKCTECGATIWIDEEAPSKGLIDPRGGIGPEVLERVYIRLCNKCAYKKEKSMLPLEIDWTLLNAAGKCIRAYGVKAAGFRSPGVSKPALEFGKDYHTVMEWGAESKCKDDISDRIRAAFTDKYADYPAPYTVDRLVAAPVMMGELLANTSGISENTVWAGESCRSIGLGNYITYKAKIDLALVFAEDSLFVEHKTSKYDLGIDGVEYYMLVDGQTAGQLMIGHTLFGSCFRGVLLLHYNISKQTITPVMITYNQRRVERFKQNIYSMAPLMRDAANHTTLTAGLFDGMNYSACRIFKNKCSLYDLCHKSETLDDLLCDPWIPGEGYESEKL